LRDGVSAKDVALAVVGRLGASGGAGGVLEFAGTLVPMLSMEQRMTLCNMSIEAGATAALVPPDDVTFHYLSGRRFSPAATAWDAAVARWRRLASTPGAVYDRSVQLAVDDLAPLVTWGTRPDMVVAVTGRVPDPSAASDEGERQAMARALDYMGLEPDTLMTAPGCGFPFFVSPVRIGRGG
jgi:homoaconitase/3-isopropylmalate dehydratase large subunit